MRSPRASANRLSSRSRPGNRLARADRVAGDEQDAGLDPVAEEGAPVGAEEVVLVAAELEVRERVGAVPADEPAGRAPQVDVREGAWRGERAEDAASAHDEHAAGRCRPTASSTAPSSSRKSSGPGCHTQRGERLAYHGGEARARRRGQPDGEAAEQQPDAATSGTRFRAVRKRRPDRGGRRTIRVRARAAGDGEAAGGLLEVEALEQVEHSEAQEQHERQAQRALAPAPEVGRGREEQQRRRDGRGMREAQRLERRELEQERGCATRCSA